MSSVFGKIIGKEQVEQAVEATLKKWMTTYLAEIERQRGIPPRSLPEIRNYTNVNEFEKWPEDQLPLVVIISPGLGGEKPRMEGDGTYTAKFLIGLATVVSADTQENTSKIAGMYGAAVRACLAQQQDLGGISTGIEWQDERFDDIPNEERRSLASVQEVFLVEVPGIVNERDGLMAVPDDPYAPIGDWPEAETVHVTINKEDE